MKKEDVVEVLNVSANKENYSQRNNKVDPGITCNTTSMVMTLDYNGYRVPVKTGDQPEDDLTVFTRTDQRVLDFYKTKMPVMYNAFINKESGFYWPNEVHDVLSYATNLYMGTNCTKFRTDVSLEELISEIRAGRACVLSGKFGKLNHIVCLVGFVLVNGVVTEAIIDDPYGDYHKGYTAGSSGNDIHMTIDEFYSIFKPFGKGPKYAHLFKAPAAVV